MAKKIAGKYSFDQNNIVKCFRPEGVVNVGMNINRKIFEGCIRYPVILFVCKIVVQFYYDRDVRWMENTIISVMLVFGIMFVNWTDIPYKWKKRTDQKSHT